MVLKARDRDGGVVRVGEEWWWQRRRGGRRSQQWALKDVCEDSGRGVGRRV